MPQRQIRIDPSEVATGSQEATALLERFAAIRTELKVAIDFPPEALQEAQRTAAHPLDLPSADQTSVPFFTIDPEGSMDLDQAMHLERDGEGYRVRYAIADLTCFVQAGGALDAAVRERGQTIYCPDQRIGLHPKEISESAGSLLADQTRPAYVWDIHVDASGQTVSSSVERALVRSVERLDYVSVQANIDSEHPDERFVLLRDIGEKLIEQERARGGASLPMPEQEVHLESDGTFTLSFRPPRPAEDWNAQISLLTGRCAADLMLTAKVGVLRTMPPPDQRSIDRFRRQAQALGTPWPDDQPYGDFIRNLDRTDPRHLALLHAATSLFRGAGYTSFDGEAPEQQQHSAVAAPYAHVTAPLRRLIDRYGLAACAAISAGEPVPTWVREALPDLPDVMSTSDRQAKAADRACADAVEAAVISTRLGQTFDAVVVDADDRGVDIQLVDLPILAAVKGGKAPLGEHVSVRAEEADIATGSVKFTIVRVNA